MNKRTLLSILPAAALLLLSACTQDEPGGQGNELPYGEYPLQIGGVTLDVESSAEPWSTEEPQTRVAENDNGTGSVWQWNGSEMIGVRLGNETATYTLNADKNLITDRQLYWTSTAPTTVTAWYPTNETVNLSDQSERLAYVLKAEAPNATYDNEIALGFKHQLAKVRVVLNGTQAALAQSVEVYGYTTCTNNEGTPTASGTQDWVKMKHTIYADGTECWEANVVPGNITLDNFVRINGQTAKINENFPATLASGNMYTIDLTVGEPVTEITADNCNNINDDGYYRVSDQFNQQISITGGKPTIYLESANINVGNGPAINITNGTPTIHVTGENTIETSESLSNCSAGIYVAEGSSVTIEGSGTASHAIRVTGGKPNIYLEDAQISVSGGNGIDIQGGSPTIHVRGENSVSSTDNTGIAVSGGATLTIEGRSTADMLTATAGNGGAGIGSPLGGTVGGNITIGNVAIHATGGSGNSAFGGAGIGSSGSGTCGDVTITDAVIMANGGDYSSGIGMGYGNTSQPSIGKITITNSDVTAKAGRYASAIYADGYE